MSKKQKVLERVRHNPKNVGFSDLQGVLKGFGFKERQPKGGSSHYIFYHDALDRIVTLTKGQKTLPEYQVKDALRAIRRLEATNEKR